MPLSEVQIISKTFASIDELPDADEGWDFELCKLDSIPFESELFQLISKDFILSRGQFNCRVKQSGNSPSGFRTFAIPAASFGMLWRSQPVSKNDLMVFPPSGKLHAFSSPGFDIFTLSFADSLLEPFVEMRKFQGLEVLHGNPVAMDRLRKLLHHTMQQPEDIETSKTALLQQLAELMTEASPVQTARTSQRIQVVLQAEQFVMDNPGESITVQSLCTTTGVSKRTLEYAFSNYLGMSPKSYINAIRLNAVHRQLRRAQPGQIRVADAANHWGFWHMGQFAADYHKLFGKHPATTLGCHAQLCKATCPFRGQCKTCDQA